MSRRGKIALAVCGAVLVAIAVAIMLFDWNLLRGFVERQVTQRSGRQLTIAGNLDVDLGFTPRIRAEKVTLANAEWAKEEKMLDVDALEFTLDLKQLFHGDVVFPEVALSHPTIALERSKDGKRNWILKPDQKPNDEPPTIGRLTVDQGTLLFVDPSIDTDLKVALSTDAGADPKSAVKFDAQGKFKGLKSSAQGAGGSVLSLHDQTLPYPIKADIRAGDTRAKIDGTITGLTSLAALDLALDLSGADLAKLYPLVGIVIPPTPPYRISGRLSRAGKLWEFHKFSGKAGDSDLAGDVKIDSSGARPKLMGNVSSRVLDIDDLAGIIGAPPKTGRGETASATQKQAAAKAAASSRVLPDQEFRLGRLRAMDADVKLKAASIRRKNLPLDNLAVHILLNDGVLKLSPLNFGVAGGSIVSDIGVDGRSERLATHAAIKFNKLQLNKLFPNVDLTKSGVGSFSGRAKLAGEGNSFAKLMASANGEVAVVTTGGKISNLLMEIAGLDGGEIIKFLLGGDRNVTLRCAVGEFKVTNGVMKSEVLVLDTSDTNITGSGTIDLKNETLNLTLIPLPKDRSILSGRSPLHATGTFKDPKFAPDTEALARRGGAALLLGLLNPLAALIPLIETGPGKDSDCKALIATATGNMARQKAK